MGNADLALLSSAKTILLTTYKRDGTPVETPVSIAFAGDRAFFRSYDKAWKTKRLRNNPEVEVAASTLRGKPVGPPGTLAPPCSTVSRHAWPRKPWRGATGCCKGCSSRFLTASCATGPCTTNCGPALPGPRPDRGWPCSRW